MKTQLHANKDGDKVRVQAWVGDILGECLCASFTIDAAAAEKLAAQLQAAIDELPRIGTPADLGCEVL